ncbi:MAG TPA: ATP-binding protein [Candidatus Sumerlaeota bacterium]|nr:ATP-binding protein [Candidatus Sumerlaeota bacterium]
MASVKIFAEEHGGCIIVESTPGEGTSFRLVLP